MTISGGSVTSDSGISGCTMVTGSQDSTEHGFLWRSLEISADYGENTVTRVSAYAADSTIVSAGGRTFELDSFLREKLGAYTVEDGQRHFDYQKAKQNILFYLSHYATYSERCRRASILSSAFWTVPRRATMSTTPRRRR